MDSLPSPLGAQATPQAPGPSLTCDKQRMESASFSQEGGHYSVWQLVQSPPPSPYFTLSRLQRTTETPAQAHCQAEPSAGPTGPAFKHPLLPSQPEGTKPTPTGGHLSEYGRVTSRS